MKKTRILIIVALLSVAFMSFGSKAVFAAIQGGDDGLSSDANKGGEEGFHPG